MFATRLFHVQSTAQKQTGEQEEVDKRTTRNEAMKNKIIRSLSLWFFGNTLQKSIDMTIVRVGHLITGFAFGVSFAILGALAVYVYFNLPELLKFP